MRPPFRPLRFQFPEEPKANRANPLKLTGKPKKAFFQRTIPQGYRYLLYNPSSEVKEKKTKLPNLFFTVGAKGETIWTWSKSMARPRSWRTKISLSSLLLLNVHGPIYGGSLTLSPVWSTSFLRVPHRSGQSVPDRSESGRFRHLGYGCATPRKVCRRRTGLRRGKTDGRKIRFPSNLELSWGCRQNRTSPFEVGLWSRRSRKREDASSIRSTGVKHDSWTQTYRNPKLYDWLLSIPER